MIIVTKSYHNGRQWKYDDRLVGVFADVETAQQHITDKYKQQTVIIGSNAAWEIEGDNAIYEFWGKNAELNQSIKVLSTDIPVASVAITA